MKLKSVLLIHRVAGPLALATVALFLAGTVAVELFGDAAAVVFVKRAILFGLIWLVLVMAAAGGTGRALGARFRRTPPLEAKTRRMPFIAANGLLVLVPSAVALDHLAQLGDVGPVFAALQAVELVAGATNLVLLALMVRDGRAMARARRPAAPRGRSTGCAGRASRGLPSLEGGRFTPPDNREGAESTARHVAA
ncbi:MAG TPA: hypothetical protein VGJ70_05210 [Solirubrobacteraceae bacterium]